MFYTVKEVSSRYKIAPATVWRWVKEGRFPQPVKLGAGMGSDQASERLGFNNPLEQLYKLTGITDFKK
ncbi:hypothetical protein MSNKSG1_16746 [Marinobacter santoriniensis NKSG1]|uniref:Helix-turn-helix domain-containing protein n=1 Tax=Marinobacter santoriniensis NKSG1 TaxID=1288826 RepID=M7CKS0_9GAMM|nr:helix-turn-helix domain-containing protein [Marinobacter santoriniensis]EMP54246.1 hypothetical protein MSNKSG1_16746 [Marinobacter santoriniensis NKSG1]